MRVLLIEDDTTLAAFISKGLKEAGYVIVHCSDGETGLEMLSYESFDAAIIDIMLPKRDGLSVIEELRRQKKTLPVLVVSAKRSVEDRVKGLHSGSDDYLTKPFAFAELLARLQALIRRSTGVAEPTTLRVSDLSLDILTHEVIRGGKKIELPQLEYALLEYLMRNAGRVISKTMIMEHVWDFNFDPQTNVVEVRICRLRNKIDRGFKTKLIHTIYGAGYVLKKDA